MYLLLGEVDYGSIRLCQYELNSYVWAFAYLSMARRGAMLKHFSSLLSVCVLVSAERRRICHNVLYASALPERLRMRSIK